MRSVIQRVLNAEVLINNNEIRTIGAGLVVLAGIEDSDTFDDISWLAQKICNLRIFDNSNGVMDISVRDTGGDIMLISQFTLHASTKKGNRPSYIKASKPEIAIPLYENLKSELAKCLGKEIVCGEFGANMKINLTNNGPVTLVIDTKNKE